MSAQIENSTDERWSAKEIALAAEAYMNMLEDEIAGREINKTAMREKLKAGGLSARSDGAIEYRMQNISHVLETMGRAWIAGYKPAGNVGPTNTEVLKRKIDELTKGKVYLPHARATTFSQLVPSLNQLMGVKAVYRQVSSFVLCFGGRGDPKAKGYYSLPAAAAKKVADQPFIVTIGGGKSVLPEYDGRVVDLVRLTPVYGPTALLLSDPDEVRRLAQWPVAIALREAWRFVAMPHLIEDLGFLDRTILAGAQDGIIRPQQIERLYDALRPAELEPARLPAGANFFDDGTPRLVSTRLPSLPAVAKEEGRRYWKLQQLTERDASLSKEAKRLNALRHGTFTCEACGFANADAAMFDAHHPTPLMIGMRTTIAEHLEILCPTCHRRAHRTPDRLKPVPLYELKKWCADGRR